MPLKKMRFYLFFTIECGSGEDLRAENIGGGRSDSQHLRQAAE